MYILSVHWDLVAMWAMLSLPGKFYLACLLASVVYTSYLLTRTLVRLHGLNKETIPIGAELRRLTLPGIESGIETVRQLHLLLLFLFGATLANEVFGTLRGIRYASMSLSGARVDVFEPCASFSFIVFGVLTLLHIFQWIASVQSRRSIVGVLASVDRNG
jgi:hypothetical protein